MTSASADIGVVGLAVMGQNLALNIADHGFRCAVHNRTTSVAERFMKENPDTPGGLVMGETVDDFVKSLKRPRRAVVMIKAGGATDAVIGQLAERMEKGDVIIDGGNAHWNDTSRREKELAERGLLFVGSGVSGGEVGARFGPSLMAGGREEAWASIAPIWEAIAAKVDPQTGRELGGGAPGRPIEGGESCAALVGPNPAGHYVKMVHNGIEYADMQIIAEAYHLLRDVGGMQPREIGEVFEGWNRGRLSSYLIEITADILKQDDPATGRPFVDVVLDAAGQKGTGRWTSVSALDLGAPAATIAEAVFARALSARWEERQKASKTLRGPAKKASVERERLVEMVEGALLCAKVCAYAQGFELIGEAAKEQGWTPDYRALAAIWRGGCIIRARLLQTISEAYGRDGDLSNLLLDGEIGGMIDGAQEGWREAVALGARSGIPMPCLGSALSAYDAFRTARLPASLIQAQRDYFGAHTYERVDRARGSFFHLDWPEEPRVESEA